MRTFFERNTCGVLQIPNRSGGQKGKGLGGRNFCPPSLSAATKFRAKEVGAPPILLFYQYFRPIAKPTSFQNQFYQFQTVQSFLDFSKISKGNIFYF